MELCYCRIVELFVNYLGDTLVYLFQNRPQMLKSNDKIDVDFILEHTTFEDLINSLIERKVIELSFKGMDTLAKYFTDRLKLTIFTTDSDLRTAILAAEVRNLFIHNQGLVNRHFMERVPFFTCSLGQRIDLVKDGLYLDLTNCLIIAANTLSVSVATKFAAKE
jgi:hypothetical protein